jgi:hypothetical protein
MKPLASSTARAPLRTRPGQRGHLPPWRALCIAVAWSLAAFGAEAGQGIDNAYAPMVVQPTGLPDKAEFDLTPALLRAQKEHKQLYVYLGASDCPYCQKYEAFLGAHRTELVPQFAPYIVVDLRSKLSYTAKLLYIRAGASSLPYTDFQRSIGDERARMLVYPSVWLFDDKLKPLMQMPAGTGTFQTVDEQLEILHLVQ